jgi:protein-L-isoaspartate(D-aspartate) O-methyltransferase
VEGARRRLVELLKLQGVVVSEEVERAMLRVPREEFVPPEYRDEAYEDHPLPIPEGQTISAPHMCAIMCEAAEIKRGDSVLEIGTGSGYHAALCAEIVSPTGEPLEGLVVTVEVIAKLARFAKENLKRAGYYGRVHLIVADGSAGAPVRATFDKILVTAAAPRVPPPLLEQLKEGGILVIPVGPRWQQLLVKVKKEKGELVREPVTYCVFVALRGRYGHEE